MLRLSDADRAEVSTAIAAAEAGSAGEIIAIATDLSDPYHDVGLHFAVLVAFSGLAFFAFAPAWLDALFARLHGWADPSQRDLLLLLLLIVLLKFVATLLIMKWMPLRLALTPGATKTRRVRRRAISLFKAAAESRTTGRTGIMIYLSMGERRAEIIGDEAITAVTDPETWGEAMTKLLVGIKDGRPADGIVAAIGEIGTVLAAHFPRDAADVNEIPDRLILL